MPPGRRSIGSAGAAMRSRPSHTIDETSQTDNLTFETPRPTRRTSQAPQRPWISGSAQNAHSMLIVVDQLSSGTGDRGGRAMTNRRAELDHGRSADRTVTVSGLTSRPHEMEGLVKLEVVGLKVHQTSPTRASAAPCANPRPDRPAVFWSAARLPSKSQRSVEPFSRFFGYLFRTLLLMIHVLAMFIRECGRHHL